NVSHESSKPVRPRGRNRIETLPSAWAPDETLSLESLPILASELRDATRFRDNSGRGGNGQSLRTLAPGVTSSLKRPTGSWAVQAIARRMSSRNRESSNVQV